MGLAGRIFAPCVTANASRNDLETLRVYNWPVIVLVAEAIETVSKAPLSVSDPLPSPEAPQAYDVRRQIMLADAPVSAILVGTDIERAKKFYVEKLGLRLAEMPDLPEDSAMFQGGEGTMIYLYEREGGSKAEHTVAGWLVEDIEKAVEELSERGVVFEQYDMPGLKTDERGIAVSGPAKSAWFKDTEGNILAVNET